MKINIKLPGGVEIDIEKEPMAPYKLYSIVWSVCLSIVLPAFFAIWK